jgi:hypothetical protein
MAKAAAQVAELHAAVKRGDLAAIKALLKKNPSLATAPTCRRSTWRTTPSRCAPLGCALGGTEGRWQKFSDATIDDWRKTAEIIRARGGRE